MMTLNDFVQNYNSKNKTTSKTKIQQVLSFLSLNAVDIYLRDGPFSSDIELFNLHFSKGTQWVCYKNKSYFDSYCCVHPKKLSKIIIKRIGHCLFSENNIQGLTMKINSFLC